MKNGPPLRILQVNALDEGGGAERVAWGLCQAYRRRGYATWLVVGRKRRRDGDVYLMPHADGARGWSAFWWRVHLGMQPAYGRVPGIRALCRLSHVLAAPAGWWDRRRGREDFHYPGAWVLDRATPLSPTVVHCHNLHGKYFDLRALPALSRRLPVFLTLHDEWMYTGHCAHSFSCPRWRVGCGNCPSLEAYPSIRKDATRFNWRRKREIYARCRLHVAAPSRWLLERARTSILAPAMVSARVVPNGVDLDTFRPRERLAARQALGIPGRAAVLLFVAHQARNNPYKDYPTLRQAMARLTPWPVARPLWLVVVGEDAPPERLGPATVQFVPFLKEAAELATYYQAADLYLHPARVDTFPNTVLEALACGTPVVASAVGGIPEQVASLEGPPMPGGASRRGHAPPTGMLVPPGDAEALASAIRRLLENEALRLRLGEHAAADARRRFDLNRQVEHYLAWYSEVIQERLQPVVSSPCDGDGLELAQRPGLPAAPEEAGVTG